MNFRKSASAFFSTLTRLYPREFREKYAADLNSVFLDILEDSGGGRHAVWPLMREIACLPACLCREHLAIEGGGDIKSTRRVILGTLLGFLGFQFLMGILSGTLIAFTGFYGDLPPVKLWGLLLLHGLLFGVFVGGGIGYALSVKKTAGMMAACALAYVVPRVFLNPDLFGILAAPSGEEWAAFTLYAAAPVSGFCYGFAVGLLWRGWKAGLAFGLASSLLSTIGFWSDRTVMSSLYNLGMERMVGAKILPEEWWLVVYWTANSLLYGVIVGFLWGILLDRFPRIRSIARSDVNA
jgi:hypothetical protein